LRWQVFATALLAVLSGFLVGPHGALSAFLGGAISVCSGWASAATAWRGKSESPGDVLVGALKAEGVKFGVMIALLLLVLLAYDAVVVEAFLGSFVLTMLIFSMAFFVPDDK
jgi:ATP synthase protein I